MKLCEGKSRLDIRKRFFREDGQPLNKLPKELFVAASLSEFKEHLNNTLYHRVCFKKVLRGAESWT